TGFGDDGIAIIDMSSRIDGADDILLQPDGSIIVIGATHTVDQFGATDPDWGVVRLTSDGAVDPTFGTNGRTVINIAGRSDGAHAGAMLSDGSIVITGRAAQSGGDDPDIAIVRIDANGLLVPTFGDNGIMWEEESGWSVEIAADAQDRIYVAGSGSGISFVQRYTSDGTLDASFASNGTFNDPQFSRANGLALDASGRLIIVGAAGGNDFGVRRLDANGAIDTSFGDNGIVTADFYGSFDQASDVVIQPDGRIVVVGKAENNLVRTVGMIRVIP